jgi:hypothetical protein
MGSFDVTRGPLVDISLPIISLLNYRLMLLLIILTQPSLLAFLPLQEDDFVYIAYTMTES